MPPTLKANLKANRAGSVDRLRATLPARATTRQPPRDAARSGRAKADRHGKRAGFARLAACLAALLVTAAPDADADEVLVAAATNVADAATAIARSFELGSPHRVRLGFGSTGKLYAQITAGAPFDVFLAADEDRPTKLINSGLAVPGARITFAIGRIALWSSNPNWPASIDLTTALTHPQVRTIAIANPALAPYGLAARETLDALGFWQTVEQRIVMGENIGQAFALVATGNAPLGFVALSQLQSVQGKRLGGRRWLVPDALHRPIAQDAVLLQRAAANPAARAFFDYLASAEARAILARFGYKTATD